MTNGSRPIAPPGPSRQFLIGVFLIALAGTAAVGGLVWSGRAITDWAAFYGAGTIVRTGDGLHLYDASTQLTMQQELLRGPVAHVTGYPLPAFAAFVFAPFTTLSLTLSYAAWFAANLVLLGVFLRLSWSWFAGLPRLLREVFLVCALVLALRVTLLGQVDLFVLYGIAGCYALLRADRPVAAGSVLALGLFKPQLIAAVVLLLLLQRQWRALAGFAAVGGLLLIVPPLTVGPQLVIDQLRPLVAPSGAATGYGFDAFMMINIRGTVVSLTNSANVWLWLPLLVLIAAVALYAAVHIWVSRPALHAQSWALAFTLPLIYSPHVHVQSLVLLIAAAGLYLVASQSSDRPIMDVKFVLAGLLAVTMLWALSIWGVSLIAFLVLAAYALLLQRWPEPAAEAAIAPQQVELALAS